MNKINIRLGAISLAIVLAFGAGACGGTDDGELSSSQAQTVTRVAWSGISQAQTGISSGINSAAAADNNGTPTGLVSSTGDGKWTISGTIKNPNGTGELQLDGNATRASTGFSATVTATFKAWSSEGVTLDGPITLTVDIARLFPADMSSTAKGTVNVSGILPVALPVSVDLTATLKGTQGGVCGSVAGQPVSIGTC